MKILIYTHAFAPRVGGVETHTMLLAQGLAKSLKQWGKENVTVVTSAPADGFDDPGLPFRLVRRPNLATIWHLVGSTDLIHLAGPAFLPLILGLLRRKPVVVEHHGFQAVCPNGQLFYEPLQVQCPGHFMAGRHRECFRCNASRGRASSFKLWLLTFLRRWLCYRVSANIAPTSWLAGLLQLPNTSVIHHGLAGNGEEKSYLNHVREPVTFAFIGRLVSTKGVHVLLQASSHLKAMNLPFHLKVIGDGPERRALEEQTRFLNLTDRVDFLGYLPVADLKRALADVVAIVAPSLSGEVFGLALLEQMKEGRILIVSNIAPFDEVIGNAGMKFSPGDSSALAQRMMQVVANPSLIETLGVRARMRATETFGLEEMTQGHLALYHARVEKAHNCAH